MFDDLDDVDEGFQVNVAKPQCLATELLAASKAGDLKREKMALGAFDDGIEKAVHNAGENKANAEKVFMQWLVLLVETIKGLAKDDLAHFVWTKKGSERCGAAMVRRMQCIVNSGEFDRVRVRTPPAGSTQGPVVLMLGRGGTQFDDLEAPEEFWKKRGCTVIRANHCGIKRLKEREMDKILDELVKNDAPRRGLIGNFFSENGSYFWCHVLGRWEACPPAGLPPVGLVLIGVVYDSCQCTQWNQSGDPMESKGAAGDDTFLKEWRKNARNGSGRHVTMNATLAMCRNLFGPDSDFVQEIADVTGPLFKGIVETMAHRGGLDDAIFDDGHWDMLAGILREPVQIPRLMFVSKSDPTLDWSNCPRHVEFMKAEKNVDVDLEIYETSINCNMHRDDPEGYFARADKWYQTVQPLQKESPGATAHGA